MINNKSGAAILPDILNRLTYCAATLLVGAALVSADMIVGTNTASATENVIKAGSNGNKAQRLALGLDKSMVLELPEDAYDILVANPDVADAVSRTARRIYIFGKDIGETNVFVFGRNGEQIANLNLSIERDISGLQQNLSKYIENSDIKVEIVNDNVLLTGTVQTAQDSATAQSLANAFLTGGGASASAARLAARRASLNTGSNNTIIISGASQQSSSSGVINLLQILGDDQVTLKVTVAEISRTVMKQLGVSTVANGSVGGQSVSFSSPNYSGLGALVGGDALAVGGAIGAARLNSYLNAMEQAGVMKTLAEPTLTAISGEKAEFRVGGEFNVLKSEDTAPADAFNPPRTTREFERLEYGIGLEFLPVVLSPGRISLKIRTAVSEPTFEGPGQGGGGSTLPSIRKRLADTTVELPSGGSMMIAGLVRDDVKTVIGGYPGLKKIPILGALFRSRDYIRNETELVIIVTPYLVRPVARNKLNRPDDNFNAASDGAGIFLGKINRVYGTMQTKLPAGRYHGVVGYIYK
jgi:pilus assembly protein CpaC